MQILIPSTILMEESFEGSSVAWMRSKCVSPEGASRIGVDPWRAGVSRAFARAVQSRATDD